MKIKVTSFSIIVCLLFSIGGCSRQTSEQGQDDSRSSSGEQKWVLEDFVIPSADKELGEELPSGENRDVLYMGLAGGTVYRYVRQYNEAGNVTGYHVQTLNAPYTAWKTKTIALEGEQGVPLYTEYLTAFTADGELHCLYGEEGACRLEKISLEEGHSRNSITSDNLRQVLEKADRWYVQGDKNYIHTPDGLYCYGQDFTAAGRTAVPDAMFIQQMTESKPGGGLYLLGVSEEGTSLCLWRSDKDAPVITVDSYVGQGYAAFCSDTEGYLCDAEHIRQFDVASGSVVPVGRYGDWGYHPEEICAVSAGEDESFLILVRTGENRDTDGGYLLLHGTRQEIGEKKTLELATSFADDFTKESILQFNQQNGEYEIVLRERPFNAEPGETALQEFEDYCTKIQAEMAGGGGPDLIDIAVMDLESGAAKGYLRELTEDFAEQRSQCEESIWQAGMVNGKVYAIPYAFNVTSLVLPKKAVGDKTSWTLEEAMRLTRESNVETFGEYMTAVNIFWNLGIRMEDSSGLIDWENRVCHLDGQEAVELLEFSREYGDNRIYSEDIAEAAAVGEEAQPGDRILREETLTAVSYLYGIHSVQGWDTHFRLCDSVPVYIGFPTENGEAQHEMYVESFAINQACKYPEAAVAFLQFLQSEKRQNDIAEQGMSTVMPVRRSSLERIWNKAMKNEYDLSGKTEIMGEEVKLEPLSPESVQRFRKVIETAKPISRRTEPIYNMIEEELSPYYAGDKSAEEVLGILQNRVQLYLNEIK